ncbi:MAG: hypothetical protein AAF065_14315 [Verrucomicrobiota bacterium]
MHVTSDYYRSRVHRIAACSSGTQGSSHVPEHPMDGSSRAHGLCRPLRPSRQTLRRLAILYKNEHSHPRVA